MEIDSDELPEFWEPLGVNDNSSTVSHFVGGATDDKDTEVHVWLGERKDPPLWDEEPLYQWEVPDGVDVNETKPFMVEVYHGVDDESGMIMVDVVGFYDSEEEAKEVVLEKVKELE